MYAAERARHEKIKADERALKLKVLSGEYISASAFELAWARCLAGVANHLRSLGDNLERRHGMPIQWCQIVDDEVDRVCEAAANEMREYCERAARGTAGDTRQEDDHED